MARALREPVPVKPFLEWAERRARILQVRFAEDDHTANVGLKYLMDEIGWPLEAGVRRLYRWRTGHENHRGMAERAVIEDALWRAGVGFWEVYEEIAAQDEERWYRDATVHKLPVFAQTRGGEWRRAREAA
jgi:hypothetical protein